MTQTSDGVSWEVFVLEYARSANQPIASLLLGVYDEGAIDLPFAFVLARRGGVNVLVDTGFMREGRGEEMARRSGVRDWISPLRLLGQLEVAPEDVTHIIVSHAHFDHMGSIDQFPRAQLYLQKAELLSWVEIMALPPRFGAMMAAFDPDDMHAALRYAEEHRLTLLDGDCENLLPGLHVRAAADGHTMGQQYVLIDTARGRFAVTGDCIYSRRNLTGTNGSNVYVPLGFGVGSVWGELKTMDRINQDIGGDHRRLLTLHDFERWSGLDVCAEVEGFRVFQAV